MQFIWQHIRTIIDRYDGALPLSHFLKAYFKAHPRLGSRDRKILSTMAYSWYRASKGFDEAIPFEEKIRACIYLCDDVTPQIARFIPDEWPSIPVNERLSYLKTHAGISFELDKLLSFAPELSVGISKEQWLLSMLRQPRLFVRIVSRSEQVLQQLEAHEIDYRKMELEHRNGRKILCLSLPNATPIDKVLDADTYVVQDFSSQQTGLYWDIVPGNSWWDCCAGAGGKSLLLRYFDPAADLVASDRRSSILSNLVARFKQYRLAKPDTRIVNVADASELQQMMKKHQFDRIICDAPCSGSGTWARTPEQLYFARESIVPDFSALQTQIVANAAQYLRPGGQFIYITCSVFKAENESVVESLCSGAGWELKEQQLINGISNQADSMFVTVLQRRG